MLVLLTVKWVVTGDADLMFLLCGNNRWSITALVAKWDIVMYSSRGRWDGYAME